MSAITGTTYATGGQRTAGPAASDLGNGGNGGRPAGNGGPAGGKGGSGIVIVAYKTDGSMGVSTASTGGTVTTSGAYTLHTFKLAQTGNSFTAVSAFTTPTEFIWSKVSAGVTHSAGIRTDGSLWLWGRNEKGQIGHIDTVDRSSPVLVGS